MGWAVLTAGQEFGDLPPLPYICRAQPEAQEEGGPGQGRVERGPRRRREGNLLPQAAALDSTGDWGH